MLDKEINDGNNQECAKDDDDDDNLTTTAKTTIKESSPFTKHFQHIRSQVDSEIKQQTRTEVENLAFSEILVDHLMDKYMPYAAIWASFTMTGKKSNISSYINIDAYLFVLLVNNFSNLNV